VANGGSLAGTRNGERVWSNRA